MRTELREGWVSFLLILAMGLCLAWTLQAAELASGIGILQWVVIVGTIIGLALARADVPGIVSHAASLIIGSAWSVFLVATLLPGDLAWIDRLLSIRLRVIEWWQQAVGGGESYDTLMFVLFTAILFWVFSYVAAYSIFRAHWVWGAILPNGVVVLMNAYYNPKLMTYFISYLLLSLLLIVRFTLFQQEDEWQRERIRYSPDLVFDFLRDGTLSAMLVIALAWFIPLKTTSPQDWAIWDVFEDPWQEVQFHWNRVFASLGGSGQGRFDFFARSITLGGPVSLSDTPIMDVTASERHYWRAMVFDEYTGSGWRNTDPEEIEIEADKLLTPMPYQNRREMVQLVKFYRAGEKVIFAANQALKVDRVATARLSYLPPVVGSEKASGGASQLAAEISVMAAKVRLRRGEGYRVVSLVSSAPPSLLRTAGEEYPDWVRERYLQLPATLPERVRVLARRITEPYDNAFDKATAIEKYLRQITYNEAIAAPPAGVDVVDWFLFEKREGYCDYYSTAMAVMLRSIGIPARVARGYGAGQFRAAADQYGLEEMGLGMQSLAGGVYTVRDYDAHAWPEVYFPNYGWIEFEPTASEPLIQRPADPTVGSTGINTGEASDRRSGRDLLSEEEPQDRSLAPWLPPAPKPWWQRTDLLVRVAPYLLPFLAIIAVVWVIQRQRRASSTLVTLAFDNMIRYARWLGVQLGPHQTPYECAAAVGKAVEEGSQDARRIAELYVREHYSGQEITVYDEMHAMDAWRRLREAIWVYLILKRLPVKEEAARSLRSALRPTA